MPLRPWMVAGIAVAVFLAGLGAGYVLHPSSAASGPTAASSTLSIVAAGSLSGIFPGLASSLANQTPGVSAPLAAELFEGSTAALETISVTHQKYDVAAAADFRLIPQLLEPSYAGWEVIFGTTPMVLAYDPTVPALSGINTTNWWQKLESPGVTLGVPNASTDPAGYNAIFTLELEGILTSGSASSVYGHFFTTPVGSLAVPNPSTTKSIPETNIATALSMHEVSAYLIYRSYVVSHHLASVTLDPRADLGELTPADLASYANASTSVLTSTGTTTTITGGPVAFGVTVPTNAPNATLGDLFVHLLLSPQGGAVLAADGFTPVTPGWADHLSAVPAGVAFDSTTLPAPLASAIG